MIYKINVKNQKQNKILNRYLCISTNHMEEALFEKHGNSKPNELVVLQKNDNSIIANEYSNYKKQVVSQYKGNWERFFFECILKQEEQHQEIINEITKSGREARQREKEISEKYQTLYNEHLEAQRKLDFLHEQALIFKKEKEEKELLKLKKQQAKKLPLRDTINPEEFHFIISNVDGKPFVKERRTLALVLLYLTGYRVSNLLLLNVRNLKELMEKGNTQISLIKGREQRFNLILSNKGKRLLLNFKDAFYILSANKNENDPIFTPINKINVPMPRENLDKELNKTLKSASELLQKNIKTHSFRATVITELLANSISIDDVKEIVGHKSINSTLHYKRSRLSPQEIKKAHNARNIDSKVIKARKKGKKYYHNFSDRKIIML